MDINASYPIRYAHLSLNHRINVRYASNFSHPSTPIPKEKLYSDPHLPSTVPWPSHKANATTTTQNSTSDLRVSLTAHATARRKKRDHLPFLAFPSPFSIITSPALEQSNVIRENIDIITRPR